MCAYKARIEPFLFITAGDSVFPINSEVATSREYHAARELSGASSKHISLAHFENILGLVYCQQLDGKSVITQIPTTSPQDVDLRHSRFSALR